MQIMHRKILENKPITRLEYVALSVKLYEAISGKKAAAINYGHATREEAVKIVVASYENLK